MICTAIEVTEQVTARRKLEENEAALENVLEQVTTSKQAAEMDTFDINMQHGKMHWDDRCRLLFGISHSQPVSYDRDFRTALPHDQQRVLEVPYRTFDKATSKGDYDVAYRTIGAEDGAVRWVKAKGKVHFDTQDNPFQARYSSIF